jgi:putative PIN family toxin of toxin-antitoxin system
MNKTSFKVVPDTNVFIAAEKSCNVTSSNKEFIVRWKNCEFEVLYSEDTLLEYISKLREKSIAEETVRKLIQALLELARKINIEFYHLPHYPIDSDDIAFLLCAENGQATHIVSYDSDLKQIDSLYSFKVCNTLEFLEQLRQELLVVPPK